MKATSRTIRVLRRSVKFLLTAVILLLNALIIWRVFFSAKIPKEVRTLIPTESGSAAYLQYGDAIVAQYQDQASITRDEASYGYFSVPQVLFLPQADQVQLVFRYNNSTLKHLQADYQLAEMPDKAGEWFDVTLVKTVDLTPENTADNTDPACLSVVRYSPNPTLTQRTETSLYTYYRYVFEGVTVEDPTVGVFADVYYVGDVDYSNSAYGTLCLYSNEDVWIPYRLTSDDLAALGKRR